MYTFNQTYTGRGSAVELPDLDKTDKALNRSLDLKVRGEEMLLDKSLRDKEQMIASMKTVPLSIQNDVLMTRQALELEKYNNLGASLYKKHGLDLPISAQLELANAKSQLESKQKTWQQEAQIAEQMQNIKTRDVRGYYDHQHFDERYKAWLQDPENNRLDESALIPAAQDLGKWLDGQKTQGEGAKSDWEDVLDDRGQPNGYKQQYTTLRGEQQAKNLILEGILQPNNEGFIRGIVERFDRLPHDVQMKYLKDYDTNHNNILDPSEKMAYQNMPIEESPIIKWATEDPELLARAKGYQRVGQARPPQRTGSSRTTFDWNTGIGGDHNQNNKFNTQNNISTATAEGTFTFPDYKNLGQVSQVSETQNISEVITSDGTTKPLNETASFHVVGYSPSKDQMVIQLDGQTSDYTYSKGDVLVVPASRFDDLLKKKPFGIFRGQETGAKTTPASSGVQWKTTTVKNIH